MDHTVLSLFSGIGGLDLAAHWAGFKTVGFIEREPFCQKVLAKHWPGVPIHDDVFSYHDTTHVDLVVGGFPCQPFSVAGNRKGADDERYLLPEMLRIISEVKPYAVLFENVPGFPSLNDGDEFKYLLRTLAEMGFDAEWGHLRASDSGAPHQRERWFLVAYAQHNGHIATAIKRSNGTAIFNHAQGQNSAIQLEGIGSFESMADTSSFGQGRAAAPRRTSAHNPKRNHSPRWNKRVTEPRGLGAGGSLYPTPLGNATSAGLERANGRKPTLRQRTRPGARAAQPRLRGTVDGLPSGMDFPGWPARPNEDQYSYEPPRIVSEAIPDRAARLKALGNAVVPQVVYPLFVSIQEWLTEIKEAQRS